MVCALFQLSSQYLKLQNMAEASCRVPYLHGLSAMVPASTEQGPQVLTVLSHTLPPLKLRAFIYIVEKVEMPITGTHRRGFSLHGAWQR